VDYSLEDLGWQLVGLALGLVVLALHRRYVRRRLDAGEWRRFDGHVRGDDPYPQRFRRVHVVVSDGVPHLTGRGGFAQSPGRLHVEGDRPSKLRDRVGDSHVLLARDPDGRRVEIALRQPDSVLLREALARVPVDRSPTPGLVDLGARRRRTADPTVPLRPPGAGERLAWAVAGILPLGVAWLWVDGEIPGSTTRTQVALGVAAVSLVVALVVGARRRARSHRPLAEVGAPPSAFR
jgi:hypothetical protein